MLRNIFRPDSGLMLTMVQITDCIFLSLFWLLCCFPVVTVGAANAALYDAVWQAFRKGEKQSWQRFFRTFRQNLRPSLVPCLVYLVLFALSGFGLIQVWNGTAAGQISWALFSAAALLTMAVWGVLGILFPMLSRFENSAGALLKNTLVVGLANLPRALVLGMVNAITLLLCVRYVFPLFFLPGLAALIGTLFIEPMFGPYMPQDGEEV